MFRSLLLAAGAVLLSAAAGRSQDQYKDYRDAASQGAKHVRAGRLADARAPLEAAAKLAKTDREKIDARRALLVPYRELQEVEPMQAAAEYVIAHSDQPAEPALTRGSLLSFVNKRGKMADAIRGYEDRLTKTADDRTALFLLTEAYGRYKDDPEKSADRGGRLIAVEEKLKIKPDVIVHGEVARQMVLAKRYKDGAELFEKLAPLDEKTTAWHYKEAAVAWQKGDDKAKALAAAKKSVAAPPEKRNDQLTYFWRRALGDTFLAVGEPALAIPEYEAALTKTKAASYLKDTQAKLAEAKAAAGN